MWLLDNQPIVEVTLGLEGTVLGLRSLSPNLPPGVSGFLLLPGCSGFQF